MQVFGLWPNAVSLILLRGCSTTRRRCSRTRSRMRRCAAASQRQHVVATSHRSQIQQTSVSNTANIAYDLNSRTCACYQGYTRCGAIFWTNVHARVIQDKQWNAFRNYAHVVGMCSIISTCAKIKYRTTIRYVFESMPMGVNSRKTSYRSMSLIIRICA